MANPKAMVRRAPQHLVCTKPIPAACKGCREYVLTCLCHGELTKLDPVHLSLKGEAMALVSGASTYLAGDTRDGVCRLRSVEMIRRGWPPTGAGIYAGHRCGMKWTGDCLDQRPFASAYYSGAKPPF